MVDRPDGVGRLPGRSPAVDFIDECLPHHDPAFLNAPSAFDSNSGRYLPILPAQWNEGAATQSITDSAVRPQPPPDQAAVASQTSENVEVKSMRFWNNIFTESMTRLLTESEEPKVLVKSGGGIRSAGGWEEVWSRFFQAHNTYMCEEGTAGTLKRMRRKVADNFSQPAAHIAKMVPDIDPWTTPVAGTIGLLLQAVTIAAKTRQDILTSLRELGQKFSNINSLAATFPEDCDVRQASVSLVVAIFQTVELAMAFFIKSPGRKVAAAILTGSDYQKELLDSFNEVQRRSDYLDQKARNAFYEGTGTAVQEILTREAQVLAGQAEGAKLSADTKNLILGLMRVYERDRESDRKERQEEQRRRDETQKQQDEMQRRERQELIALVHQLQISPRPVSPLPAPLALLPPPSSPSYNSYIPSFPTWTAQALLQLLGVPDGSSDLVRVKNLENTLARRDKKKVDQVVQTELFGKWMTSLRPAKLLIQGDFRGSRTISPLSSLAATLTEAARVDSIRFISLVFFCSCHTDPEEDYFTGGRALIQTLICQLLQQQPQMSITSPPWEFHPDLARQGDLRQLCQLFNFLVHSLPSEMTLFCFVDGLVVYERDEFVAEAQFVVAEILQLVGDPTVQANTKFLITSPWRSKLAHQFFQEDNEILRMQGMTSVELIPSFSRVISSYMSRSESDHSRESSPEP